MSDDEADFHTLVDDPETFEKFMNQVKEGYIKKFNLVKKAREIIPETFSQKDFAEQMLKAFEANFSDQIVFLDIIRSVVENNGSKIRQLDNRLKRGEKITNWWDRPFEDESEKADKK